LGDDPGYLAEIRSTLETKDLYCELDTRGSTVAELEPALRVAQALGAATVRSYLRFPHGRFDQEFMTTQVVEVQRVVPLLESHRIRLAFENHEYETSGEMIDFVTQVGSPDTVGLLCDVGNSMMAWEDPIASVTAMAPYTFGVHFKDHTVVLEGNQQVVCGVPLGEGNIDLEAAYRILVDSSRADAINLESCYPYCATFKRPAGTGGWQALTGAFEIQDPPFPPDLVSPMGYYHPHQAGSEALGVLLRAQESGLAQSLAMLRSLRDRHPGPTRRP